MKYHSGEEIRKGDKVLFHDEPGEMEFVVEKLIGDPAMDWYMKEQGTSLMILAPKSFVRVYTSDTENDEDLEFVLRG